MNIETIKNLNKLKNASSVNHELIALNANILTQNVLKCLYKEGFILSYRNMHIHDKNSPSKLLVKMRYLYNKSIFQHLKIKSSSSKRIFFSLKDISKMSSKKSLLVFSTNKGLLTLNECKKLRVGGILLFTC
jgi:ribosomal protein S8